VWLWRNSIICAAFTIPWRRSDAIRFVPTSKMLFHGVTFVPPVLSVLLRGGSSVPATAEHLPPAAGLLPIFLPTADNLHPADAVQLHVVIVVIAVAAVLPAVIFNSVLAMMTWHCYLFQPCPILGTKGRKCNCHNFFYNAAGLQLNSDCRFFKVNYDIFYLPVVELSQIINYLVPLKQSVIFKF
jgi:hypothetical protein